MPRNAGIVLVGANSALTETLARRGFHCRAFNWNDALPEDRIDGLSGLILVSPEGIPNGDPIAYRAFRLLQWASPSLRTIGKSRNTVLVAVTRCGGKFGLDATSESPSDFAGLSGLIKTASHEWPEVACKVIDVDPTTSSDQIANELLIHGPIEVGLRENLRFDLAMQAMPQAPVSTALTLALADLVVVTGGARGVTAACTIELARRYRPTMLLMGRTQLKDKEPAWLLQHRNDAQVKQAIIANWQGGKPTPREVEREFQNVVAQREIRATMSTIRSMGAAVEYHASDVRDAQAMSRIMADARQRYGPIRGIVHGSGVLADKRIEDKSIEQFATVYQTKVDGFRSLLAATKDDPLAFIALFSSSTARFGRTGQCDYAAANEVLNAEARRLVYKRPNCRVVSFNWGPWDGGMVTPALRKLFASENVGVIPVDSGARFFVAELSANDRPSDVVVLNPNPTEQPRGNSQSQSTEGKLAFRRKISVEQCPVLESHVLDGKAVLPIALGLEWLAHAAMLNHPGLEFSGCNQLRVLHRVAIPLNDSIEIALVCGEARRDGKRIVVSVELHGPRPGGLGVCFRADVVLGKSESMPLQTSVPNRAIYSLDVDDAYTQRLFHGPELRGIESISGCDHTGISGTANRAPKPESWLTQPLRGNWLADPLVIDCALQALILWTWNERNAPSLPLGWVSFEQYRPFNGDMISFDCRVTQSPGAIVRADIDFMSDDGTPVACLRGAEMVVDPNLTIAFGLSPRAGGVTS